MLVTLKNLEKETFQIDIDPSCTVKELKEKVERDKGANYAAPLQKLIYSGKILQDEEVESGIPFQNQRKNIKTPSHLLTDSEGSRSGREKIYCVSSD